AATAGRNGFRDDLFFRIAGITLTVPSLRERPNALPALLVTEIARASRRHGTAIVGLDREAADRLLEHAWPGNLRELSKVIQAAVALTTGDVIGREQLLLARDSTQVASGVSPDVASGFSRTSRSPDVGHDAADRSLRHAVHRHIVRVLDEVG